VRLSERQKAIFDRLGEIIRSGEPIPTVATLGRMFGISQQAMSKNLKVLEEADLIRRDRHKHRSIELVKPPPQAVTVDLLGRITAGQPLEAVETSRNIEVPASLVPPGDAYALEVRGDSMIEDGILDGDVVVIQQQTMAYNGQTVVAVINGEATLKRYYHEGHRIRLQPANARLKPIFVTSQDDFEIRGIVYALFRKMAQTVIPRGA